jgi:hypothetical protein
MFSKSFNVKRKFVEKYFSAANTKNNTPTIIHPQLLINNENDSLFFILFNRSNEFFRFICWNRNLNRRFIFNSLESVLVLIVCREGCRHHFAHQSVCKGFVGRLRGLKDTVQVVGTNRIFIVPSIRCLGKFQFRQSGPLLSTV